MKAKEKLQRALQILEQSERVGALTLIEKDILLNDLRDAYAELKFGETVTSVTPTSPVAVVTPEELEEPEAEPEVEVELVFADEENDEGNDEATPATAESAVVEPTAVAEPVAEPVVVEAPQAPQAPQTPIESIVPPLSEEKRARRNAILSLYEESTPVIGEQFHEALSVGESIACPKGVAESASVKSLREAIGVADKFLLMQELFGGDAEAYEQAIDTLDSQPSLDECVVYIAEHYAWSPNAEGTKYMMDLINRKYN